MNQFKVAKEKNKLAGQKTESVSDLRSAGIEPEKIEELNESLKVEKELASIEINEPVKTIEEDIPQINIDITTTEINNTTSIETQENGTVEKAINPQENQDLPVIQKVNIVTKEQEIENSVFDIKEQIAYEEAIQVPKATKLITIQPEYEEKIVKKINEEVTTSKKKIPNIFAPKEEAKSVRKSLVLKPTSVKKAENYCNKNGGSFNELIQTLLDNFIDEYGI